MEDQKENMDVDDTSSSEIIPLNSDSESNSEKTLFCWGHSDNGELGLGKLSDDKKIIITPVQLEFPNSTSVKHVACGRYHTLVITDAGQIFSCGNNEFGQLGHDKDNTFLNIVDGLSQFVITHVVTGQWHSLALNEWGEIFTWGADTHGQLGLDNIERNNVHIPKRVKSLASKNIVQACAGYSHCLVLTNGGELYAWGNNEYGQLGINSHSALESKPHLIESLTNFPIALIACGANHCFVLSKSGAVYGWGKNNCGQLGLNDEINRCVPHQIKSLRNIKVKYIACGEDYTVFLTQDGGVFTCGDGSYGQLGHGCLSNELLPRKVLELMGSTVTQVSCGRRHTLTFIPSAGRLYAFGIGTAVQLENPKSLHKTPQLIQGPWFTNENSDTTISRVKPIVKKIYSGGDRSIVTVSSFTDRDSPDDFRWFNAHEQILDVKYEILKECQVQVEHLKEDDHLNLDLLHYLESVFLSPACLNGSFLKLKDDEHFCCNSKNHGVDMAIAQECFDCISKIDRESVRSLIFNSICQLVKTLGKVPPDAESLRMFLTLPLYHEFMNVRHYRVLQIPFAEAVLSLQKGAAQILGQWYTSMSSDYYERLIQIYKQLFVFLLQIPNTVSPTGEICWNSKMSSCLKVLRTLNALNNQNVKHETLHGSSKHSGLKVAYTSFYISELRNLCDIKIDYVKWEMSKRRRQALGSDFLCNYPFIFNAEIKTILLETDQIWQMQDAMSQSTFFAFLQTFDPRQLTHFLSISVSRENIVADTIRELSQYSPSEFKKPLKVRFKGEEAEDAGGVRREFLMLLLKEILDPKYGMFKEYEETRTIWFNENSFEDYNMYCLIGTICGLTIYNYTIINMPFPLALYKKILDEPIVLQDLKDVSPTQARSLQDMLDYTEDDFEDVYCINFEISRDIYGETQIDDLKPNGRNIPVNQTNKQEFVDLYIDFLFNKSVNKQFIAFKTAFLKVCGSNVLSLFHAQELMAAVIGNENYDWYEFENNAEYKNGYTSSDPTIQLFWNVFHELPLEEKKKFLLFLTGCDRVPIKGMKDIKIFFQPIADDRLLPVAHTCNNLLDLPRYKTKERLRYKLLQAIQQTSGFSLV